MSQHTPGPWHYQESSDAYTHIVRGRDNQLIFQASQDTSGQSEADARIAAALLDLLEACKRILKELRDGDVSVGAEEDLESAIAKAEEQS